MCGCYALTVDLETMMNILANRYGIQVSLPFEYQPRYNIAPGQQVISIINDGSQNRVGTLQWGFIPSWAEDPSIGYKMINARAETIGEKPAFKTSFVSRRCIILADSFYEWKREENEKVPMRVKLKNNNIFALAGLWSSWKSPENHIVYSCTIVTTIPNPLLSELHHRMPVILPPDREKSWLNPFIKDPDLLTTLLQPYPEDKMEYYQVSPLVNSWKNDIPECILPVT